jgi:hypothetical protein
MRITVNPESRLLGVWENGSHMMEKTRATKVLGGGTDHD